MAADLAMQPLVHPILNRKITGLIPGPGLGSLSRLCFVAPIHLIVIKYLVYFKSCDPMLKKKRAPEKYVGGLIKLGLVFQVVMPSASQEIVA